MSSTTAWNDFDALYDNTTKKKSGSKRTKPSKTPSAIKKRKKTFQLRSLPVSSTVTEEDVPDIMTQGPVVEPSSTELLRAETSFFNKKNSDFWQRDDLSHLRPYDFPYIRALLQQPPQDTLSPEDTRHKEQARSSIEVVTRAYEEKFLREPIEDERACVMNENCQGNKLPHINDNKFTLREFLLPSEDEEAKRTGQWPKERRLCILCKRAEIARAFINIRADGMGVKDNVILQDYRNLVNIPGEYCLEDCILSSSTIFQGLLDPVVLHVKSAYRIQILQGVRHLQQWGMKYPEHRQHFLSKAPGE
jgi:hypothetical protein